MSKTKKSKPQHPDAQLDRLLQFWNGTIPKSRTAALKGMTKETLIDLCLQLRSQLEEEELMAGDQADTVPASPTKMKALAPVDPACVT